MQAWGRFPLERWNESCVPAFPAMLCAPAILVGLGLLGWLPATAVMAIQFAYWFGGGFLAPNTAAGVMMSHPAAAVASIQGLIYDGSIFPMVGMQVALGLATWMIWARLKRYTV